MNLKLALLFQIFFSSMMLCFAQDSTKVDKPYIFDQYQIFLEEEIMHLIFLEYEKEELKLKLLNGHLFEDKSKIILDDYDGKNRVKMTFIDKYGELKTLSKSKCFIDPFSPL